jgi:hypothetical protein
VLRPVLPMIDVFANYFWRYQLKGLPVQLLVLIYSIGFVIAYGAMVFLSRPSGSARSALPLLRPLTAMVSPLLGLIFVGIAYYCPICSTKPDWCEVAIVGVPFPSSSFGMDLPDVGPRTQETDSCGDFFMRDRHVKLNASSVGNFLVGILALPLVLACTSSRLSRRYS